MPHCPDCRTEYEEGPTFCADCGVTLAAGPLRVEPAATQGEEAWTSLLRVRKPDTAQIIEGLLESAGIECQVVGKSFGEMPVPAVDSLARIDIWVPESRAAEARALLADAREATKACSGCGHLSSADEPACEYCGAVL